MALHTTPFRLLFRSLPLLLCLLLFSSFSPAIALHFRDVSVFAGLTTPVFRTRPKLKYGGASVADLDGDGYPDLLCGHHDSGKMQIYFNQRNGTFLLHPFGIWRDIHGLNAVRLRPRDRGLHFTVSVGGSFGTRLTAPMLFHVNPVNRTITDVSLTSGDIMHALGRGRTTLFLPLRTNPEKKVRRPDMLVLGANTDGDHHYALQIDAKNKFKFRKLRGVNRTTVGYRKVKNSHAIVTDVDNDGTLEIVSFKTFSIWRLVRDFTLEDVTAKLLPAKPGFAGNRYVGSAGVAELDFNNDGWWDLFLTRSPTAQLYWVQKRPIHDALLRNVNGVGYEDITTTTGVPIDNLTYSRGVTTGDFDNDGYVDIVLCDYRPNTTTPYTFLHNVPSSDGSGRRIFNARYDIPGLTTRGRGRSDMPESQRKGPGRGINGDGVTAVDYDLDGRLDLILSEGDWFDEQRGGTYRVLHNVWNENGYLLVRVKNAPKRRASSMHAVVRVVTDTGLKMMRRVGSPGTMVSNSFVESVHFGVGKAERIVKVSVTWIDGSVRYRENVGVNQRISFGVL